MAYEPKLLLDGLVFPEGPRWRDGKLWFSDMQANRVMTVDEQGHAETVFELPDDRPSGLGWLPDGRLLVVAMAGRKLLRREADGELVLHADLSGIAPRDCNDMVVDAGGRAYVGNFGFNFQTGEPPVGTQLAIVEPDGAVRPGGDGLIFPNGSVITADGKTLIVGETFGRRFTAFDIGADGSLSNARPWADLGKATPDGCCLDSDGAIWAASPTTREYLRVHEGGEISDRIPSDDEIAIACMLGGADGKTLFLLNMVGDAADIGSTRSKGVIRTVRVTAGRAGWP
ncbi:MAG: SMP-30/gluconolactonase/LRE family protein [Chloroflexi bacterium]|nr:SMP-30/gluconolactonase/LRE family protein [Chloroflexota bacterium]